MMEILDLPDYLNKGQGYTKEQIEDIRFMLTRNELRDLYDKHGMVMGRE